MMKLPISRGVQLLLCSLVLGGLFFSWYHARFLVSVLPNKVWIDGKEYALEIADNEETRSFGLGNRSNLCEYCGMFFVFDVAAKHAFWMKGMQFPLDIVWLHDDVVVHIERHIEPESQMTYIPSVAANRVLEFNAGTADTLNVGEKVSFTGAE